MLRKFRDQMEKGVSTEEAYEEFVDSLKEKLSGLDTLEYESDVIQILKSNTDEGELIDPSRGDEDINLWRVCWIVLFEENLFRAADRLIEACYNHLLYLQKENGERYHKGTPLQTRAEGWAKVDRFEKAKRFAILAFVEDIITGQKRAPALRTLKRAGLSKADMDLIEKTTEELLEEKESLYYPEEVYQRVKSKIDLETLGELEKEVAFTNKEYLSDLLEKVEAASENGGPRKKGRTLEDLSQYLFSSIESMYFEPRRRTEHFELDGVITNTSTHPFLKTLDNYIIVECKNWKKPVGSPELMKLLGKLDVYQCNEGVLLSKEGIKDKTSIELRRDAYRRSGTAVFVIDKNDIESIIEGKEDVVSLLINKFKELKFATGKIDN